MNYGKPGRRTAPWTLLLFYNLRVRPVTIVFAKAPVAGRVKTRLTPPLTAGQAASLHTALVWDLLERLRELEGTDLELHTDGPPDAWADLGITSRLQVDGDLGERMLHAIAEALGDGRPAAMIVGGDSPDVPLAHLEGLLESPFDVALGPARDGGYYAIRCRRHDAGMFRGVKWSSAATLEQTLRSVRECGLSAGLGEPWYDVDDYAGLEQIRSSAHIPRHTLRWLCENGWLRSREAR